jgi:hypothetical protein
MLVTKRTGALLTVPGVPVTVTGWVSPHFAYCARALAHGVGLPATARTVPSSMAT